MWANKLIRVLGTGSKRAICACTRPSGVTLQAEFVGHEKSTGKQGKLVCMRVIREGVNRGPSGAFSHNKTDSNLCGTAPPDGRYMPCIPEVDMKNLHAQSGKAAGNRGGRAGIVLPLVLLALAPIHPAHAYIDPNAAGPLYQMLFPLLVAIGSGIAMARRYIRELWNRAVVACTGLFRRRSLRDDGNSMP